MTTVKAQSHQYRIKAAGTWRDTTHREDLAWAYFKHHKLQYSRSHTVELWLEYTDAAGDLHRVRLRNERGIMTPS